MVVSAGRVKDRNRKDRDHVKFSFFEPFLGKILKMNEYETNFVPSDRRKPNESVTRQVVL